MTIFRLLIEWLGAWIQAQILYPFALLRACLRSGQSSHELNVRSFLVRSVLATLSDKAMEAMGFGLVAAVFSFFIGAAATSIPLTATGCFLGLILSPVVFALLLLSFRLISGALVLANLGFIRAILPPCPTPSQVSRWYRDSMAKLRQHALARLGLTEEQAAEFEPVPPTISAVLWPVPGVANEDLLWRFEEEQDFFGVYRIIFVFFGTEHMGVYACDFNFIKDVSLNDETYEVSYQDIVTFQTSQENSAYTLPTGKKLNLRQSYSVSVQSGQTIVLGTATPNLRIQLTGREAPESPTELSIATIREYIRSRKLALAPDPNDPRPQRPAATDFQW